MKIRRILTYFGIVSRLCLGSSAWGQTEPATTDSTFWILSLPEIQSYRAYFLQELESLQEEKRNLIDRGIEDGEYLLRMNPSAEVVDEILVRLADLYYYREKDAYFTRMAEYDDQLLLLEQGELTDIPEEPQLSCEKSLEIYQRIIDEFPQSDLVDDAIYNKAFLYEEMGQNIRANQIYVHLIDAYPASKYVPEAYMRLGEYHFNPPVNDLPKAIAHYKSVLNYKDSPRYEEALYKLGWSHYRLSQYPEAISYFTTLVENTESMEKYDPLGLSARPDLRNESVEYIAISFIDFGGAEQLSGYLEGIGNPDWGRDALAKLGDVLMQEKEDFPRAAEAYEALLQYDPSALDAPVIQRKIVDCSLIMQDEMGAFNERQELFTRYRQESVWWENTTDEKAKLKAYRLVEQALRENIFSMIKRAEELDTPVLYEKIVEWGRTYLDAFPEDIYAYMVRWNVALILDTKLHRFKDALQEYLTISMVYNEDRYSEFARNKGLASIKDAAENAIVVADSLVRQTMNGSKPALASGEAESKKEPLPLTTEESWLAMAYDNFIKMYPFDNATPNILANAGALYYTHNQFAEALKYFKTLVKYFPQSEQIPNVQLSILESYFGKLDYDSAEILAKRIMNESPTESMREKARTRLGEAIFLKAQTLAEAGQAKLAAEEFYRMGLEAPSLEFADRALFNAGREFESIGAYDRAVRAYELLRLSHSGSSLLPDALNNMAFNLGEMEEYEKGADRYVQLATILNNGEQARDALYNALVFYEKAENWPKAIQAGKAYAMRYPDMDDADEIYFKTGRYYLKLDSLEGALRVYADISDRFPRSPLSIEASYRLGQYYEARGMKDLAVEAYMKGCNRSRELEELGLDPNAYYAAEGLFHASRILQEQYAAVEFKLPLESLNRSISRKQQMLQRLVDQYTRVIGYATLRLPESVFRIGEVYEDYAQTLSDQELPPMDATAKAVKYKEINEATTRIYNQALTAYYKAIEAIDKVGNGSVSASKPDSVAAETRADTLLSPTTVWRDRSENKVTEMLYRMAELNERSVERILNAPIPGDLGLIARLEYRSQVFLKAVKPIVDIVVNAHSRNLRVADSLQIENEWTELSSRRLISSANLTAESFRGLALEALDGYTHSADRLRYLAFREGNNVTQDLVNTTVNFIDLSKSYAQASIVLTKESSLRTFDAGLPVFQIEDRQRNMVRFIMQIADSLEARIVEAQVDQSRAEALFEREGDIQFEEILAVFEDNVYFLQEELREVLESGYATLGELPVETASAEWIAARLVRMDPDTYAERLHLPVMELVVPTDTTWFFSTGFREGWTRLSFNMAGWFPSRKTVSSGTGTNRSLRISGRALSDGSHPFFIRKEIDVPGFPVAGRMVFRADSTNRYYLNSRTLEAKIKGSPVSITPYLREGKNLLAVECPPSQSFSMEGAVLIRYVPRAALVRKKE